MPTTIYHNPRCSKSRETLELLKQRGVALTVVEYLNTPPDAKTLREILALLGIPAEQLLRKHEAEYQLAGLDKADIDEEQIITAMVKYPKLIERPIVVSNNKAAIGRPPSRILDILPK